MVTITIIGWYGTETIGDRAIFAGLLRIFSECFDRYVIKWGSLIPHLTERTLLEDNGFYKEISDEKLKRIEIFDSLSAKSLKTNISESDILAIGGGPLMDIQCMYMLEYALKYAKKRKVRTLMLGCGWGPLKQHKYVQSAVHIVQYADLAIFRDSTSMMQFKHHYKGIKDVYSLIDPAFFSAQYFADRYPQIDDRTYIAVNFRDLKVDESYDSSSFELQKLVEFINFLLKRFPEKQIKLIPMHTFYVGGDDRIILEKIYRAVGSERLFVQHKPLSLKETMSIYRDALFCIGMRFHSIVLQTMVNGYNYILDYTEPQKGKIIGMIRQLEMEEQLKGRYASVTHSEELLIDEKNSKLEIGNNLIEKYREDYVRLIRSIL